MKTKTLIILSLLSFAILSIHSCGDEPEPPTPEVRLVPFFVYVTVSDENGTDLLKPGTEYSIAENGIKAIYQGKVYEKDSAANKAYAATRFRVGNLYGLQSTRFPNGRHALMFGELEGDLAYRSTPLILDWGDGSKCDTVTFVNHINVDEDYIFNYRSFFLNGKDAMPPIEIVKKQHDTQ